MLHEPLKDRALGRWRGILTSLGVPGKALTNRHGPCPVCGGKDRFRFDDQGGRGTWICSRCGAGDGIELVKRLLNIEFREAAKLIEQQIGTAPEIRNKQQTRQTDELKRSGIVALWNRSHEITLDDQAGRYLQDRTGLTTFPRCLRYCPDERYTEAGSRPTWHPLLARSTHPMLLRPKASGRRSIALTSTPTAARLRWPSRGRCWAPCRLVPQPASWSMPRPSASPKGLRRRCQRLRYSTFRAGQRSPQGC
jgi:putative DNA primase/helicase